MFKTRVDFTIDNKEKISVYFRYQFTDAQKDLPSLQKVRDIVLVELAGDDSEIDVCLKNICDTLHPYCFMVELHTLNALISYEK